MSQADQICLSYSHDDDYEETGTCSDGRRTLETAHALLVGMSKWRELFALRTQKWRGYRR